MRSSILTVFLETVHRYCRFHIFQNVQEKLGPFVAKHEDLRLEFNDIIDYSLTPVEFEEKWAQMLERHNVADNTHLLDLYDLVEFFVLAYFHQHFFPLL
jgi:hypothetical protein